MRGRKTDRQTDINRGTENEGTLYEAVLTTQASGGAINTDKGRDSLASSQQVGHHALL